jgi:hypothetical protein
MAQFKFFVSMFGRPTVRKSLVGVISYDESRRMIDFYYKEDTENLLIRWDYANKEDFETDKTNLINQLHQI